MGTPMSRSVGLRTQSTLSWERIGDIPFRGMLNPQSGTRIHGPRVGKRLGARVDSELLPSEPELEVGF